MGSTSTKPDSANDLPMARRRCWAGVRPRPAGAGGSTDGMASRPSSRSTSSTRSAGCTQIRPPTRRRTTVAVSPVDGDRGTDLGQPAHRGAVGVADAGDPVGQVQRRCAAAAATNRRAAGRRASRSASDSTVPLAISASSAAQRSSAATGDRGVDATLVAATGLADQMQPALGARNRGRVPHRRLQQHVGGGRRGPRWCRRPSRRRWPRSRRRRRSARRPDRVCAQRHRG